VPRFVEIVLAVDDRGTATVRKFSGAVRAETDKLAGVAAENFARVGQNLERLGGRLTEFGTRFGLLVSAPIAAIGFGAAKAAIDFESSFAGVRKTVDATDEELKQLSQGIRQLAAGPKAIPINVDDLNRIAEAAGQLGIEKENIVEFTRVMAQIGATTNLSAEEAANGLARFANIMRTPQQEAERLGSTIVDLGNKLAATEAEIVEMGLRLAGAGKQIGLTEAQVFGFAGALASVGIEAESGGTALSRVFVEIAKQVRSGGDLLDDFAKVAGLSVADFSKLFEQDAKGAIVAFIKGLDDTAKAGGDVFTVLEGLELENVRVRDALLRLASANDTMVGSLDTAETAWKVNNALAIEFGKRMETTASQLQIAKNQIRDAAIEMGENLAPAVVDLTRFVARLATHFGKLPEPVQDSLIRMGAFAAALGPVVFIGGQVIRTFGAMLPVLASGASGAIALALGFDKVAIAMASSASAAHLFTAATVGQKLGILGLVGAVGGLSFALTRAISEVTGLDAVMTNLFERALGHDVEGATRRLENFGQQADQIGQLLEQLAGKGIDVGELRFDPRTVEFLRERLRIKGEITFEGGLEAAARELESFRIMATAAGKVKIVADASALFQTVNDLQAQLGTLRRLVNDMSEQDLVRFRQAFSDAAAQGGSAAQVLKRALELFRGSQKDAAKELGDANEKAKLSAEELKAATELLEAALAKSGFATQKMADALLTDFNRAMAIANAQGLDATIVYKAFGKQIEDLTTGLVRAGQTIPEELGKLLENVEIPTPDRIKPIKIGLEFDEEQLDEDMLERVRNSFTPPEFTEWDEFFGVLNVRSQEFVDGIGTAWAQFVEGGIASVGALAGQVVTGQRKLSEGFAAMRKSLAADAVNLLVQWAIRRLIVSKLSVASTAHEAAAELAKGLASVYVNTFAWWSSIFPPAAPAAAAAATGVATAGAATSAAAGAALGTSIVAVPGAAEGAVVHREQVVNVGEFGRPEAIVPLSGPAARRAGEALGLRGRNGGANHQLTLNVTHQQFGAIYSERVPREFVEAVAERLYDMIEAGVLRALPTEARS